MTQKPTVAVIGLGNIGTAVATNLVKGNRAVILANKTPEKAKQLAAKLGSNAQPAEVAEAIKKADIVILAVWFDTIKELFKTYAGELQGKIIIDPSNPIAPDEKGGFKKNIGKDESAGEILLSLLPKDAHLVKALGSLGAASLSNSAFQQPDKAVLFYATNDRAVTGSIEELIHDIGFEPVKLGGIGRSIRMEVFGDLHEFGALGKTITLKEAEGKI